MLLTIGAAVVVLGAVIFVHELGHFLVAKATGVGVIRFSIGFGPATPLRFQRGGTEYVVSWFPLGGYVMMASEEEAAPLEGRQPDRAYPPEEVFENKPLAARILVILAGVLMNVAFAWVLYLGMAAGYGERIDPTTVVAAVDSSLLPPGARELETLAYPANLVRINGDTVRSWNDVYDGIMRPTTGRLTLEFSGRGAGVAIAISGAQTDARGRLFLALKPGWAPRLGYVAPGGPAAAAGLRAGDLVLGAAGDSLRYWHELVRVIEGHPGDTLRLAVARGDSVLHLRLVPSAEQDTDLVNGGRHRVGKIGVSPQLDVRHLRFGLAGSVREADRRTLDAAGLVVFTVKGLLSGKISLREVGGPIMVGQLSGQAARIGLESFLGFIALFSVNLAVLNLLPIPVLDGGRLLFLLVEGIRRRPVSLGWRMRLSQAGVALLLAIMALVVVNDLLRVFGR